MVYLSLAQQVYKCMMCIAKKWATHFVRIQESGYSPPVIILELLGGIPPPPNFTDSSPP